MRKFTYIDCPECGKELQSLGYASHRAMHRREREQAKKLQQPAVSESFCECSFAMIRRDQITQKAYCFECKKEIKE